MREYALKAGSLCPIPHAIGIARPRCGRQVQDQASGRRCVRRPAHYRLTSARRRPARPRCRPCSSSSTSCGAKTICGDASSPSSAPCCCYRRPARTYQVWQPEPKQPAPPEQAPRSAPEPARWPEQQQPAPRSSGGASWGLQGNKQRWNGVVLPPARHRGRDAPAPVPLGMKAR